MLSILTFFSWSMASLVLINLKLVSRKKLMSCHRKWSKFWREYKNKKKSKELLRREALNTLKGNNWYYHMTCTTPRERGPPVRKKTSGFALPQLFWIFPEREIKMEEGGLGEKKRWENESGFSMNYEFLVLNQRKKYDSKLPKVEFLNSCPALAKVVIYTMPIDIV